MVVNRTFRALFRRAFFRRALFLVVPVLGGGCGPAGGAPEDPAFTVVDSAGVTIVTNERPSWAEGEGWRVGDLLTSVGTQEGAQENLLYGVFDATRLSDGTLVVANSGTAELRFFTPRGDFIRSVGRIGDGPGEFSRTHTIRALVRRAGDSLLTWDIYGQRLSLFDPSGEFVRATRFSQGGRMLFWRGVFPDGTILFGVINPDRPNDMKAGLQPRVVRTFLYGAGGDSLGVAGDYVEGEWLTEQASEGAWMLTEPPFSPVVTLKVKGEHLALATGDAYEYRIMERSFDPIIIVRRSHTDIPVEESHRAWFMETSMGDRTESFPPALRRRLESLPLPEHFPPYQAMRVDSEENVWLQDYRTGPGLPDTWAVFDPSGHWLGTVTLPAGLEIYEIGPDYILGKETDDLGIERVRVYALEKTPTGS